MNLEMPSPAEADSLRTILLIVLGVMILTIPVVCVIVVAKVTAQRKQDLRLNQGNNRACHDTGGMDPMIPMGAAALTGFPESNQSEAPPHHSKAPHHCHGAESHHTPDHSAAGDSAIPTSGGESSSSDSSRSFSDGGSSFSKGSGGGGSGGGGGSSD